MFKMAPRWFKCSVDSFLKFWTVFEDCSLDTHFEVGLANYSAISDYIFSLFIVNKR